jgi:hypothetical protein
VGDLSGTAKFRDIAAETIQALHERGLDVMPLVVDDCLRSGVQRLGDQLGVTPRTALDYLDPRRLAAQIAEAADHGLQGIRPLRDGRTVAFPAWTAGRLIGGLSQAVKYAAANGDTETPGRAADLLTELGIALLTSRGAAAITVDHGCLTETAGLLEQVAGRIATGEWSSCPCEVDHGQATLDARVAPAMHQDAAFAREAAVERPAEDPHPAEKLAEPTAPPDGGARPVE